MSDSIANAPRVNTPMIIAVLDLLIEAAILRHDAAMTYGDEDAREANKTILRVLAGVQAGFKYG